MSLLTRTTSSLPTLRTSPSWPRFVTPGRGKSSAWAGFASRSSREQCNLSPSSRYRRMDKQICARQVPRLPCTEPSRFYLWSNILSYAHKVLIPLIVWDGDLWKIPCYLKTNTCILPISYHLSHPYYGGAGMTRILIRKSHQPPNLLCWFRFARLGITARPRACRGGGL